MGLFGKKKHIPESNDEFFDFKKLQMFELDQFRHLRTKVLFPASGRAIRSVAITSVGIGDGKSFVSANLAASIAQTMDDKNIFLIDCDIRHPTIHRYFGFDKNVPGLSEYLSGDIPLAPLLLKPDIAKLTILAGGTPPPNPSELLSSKKMMDLLDEIQTRYEDRYFIMDIPSPLIVAESSVLARNFDGIMMIIRYGKVLEEDALQVIDILGRDKVIGVVLNRFDTSMHSSFFRLYKTYISRK